MIQTGFLQSQPMGSTMTKVDWDDLVSEREAIMWADAGIQESMAKVMARADITKRFGPRPKGKISCSVQNTV